MSVAFIGIGSNIGDRLQNLQDAVTGLKLTPFIDDVVCSGVYQTKPVGYDNQDDFFNAVVKVETELSPNALLGVCLGIESGMKRKRIIKNGPRIIDLDLLLYDHLKIDTKELVLPHPRMFERAFVLCPLYELLCSEDIKKYLDKIDINDVKKISDVIE